MLDLRFLIGVSIALGIFGTACSSTSENVTKGGGGATGATGGKGGSGGGGSGGTGAVTQGGGGTAQGGTGGVAGGTGGVPPDASTGGTGGGVAGATGTGACGGKDCLGGACVSNTCQGIKIASSTDNQALSAPLDIAVDLTHVYFTVNHYDAPNQGSIMKASINGGQVQVLADKQTSPYHIAIDQGYVYWTNKVAPPDAGVNAGSVWRISKTATTSVAPTNLAFSQPAPVGISVDSDYAYWSNFVDPGGTIKRSKKDASDNVFTLDTNQTKPWGTVADPGTTGYVYYAVQESGRVRRVSKTVAGGTDVTTGSHPGAHPIALDGEQLFFGRAASTGGEILTVTKTGSSAATPMTNNSFSPVVDIALDAQYVYFTTQRFGSFGCVACVMRIARSGGTLPAEKIWKLETASNPNPAGIAVDDKAIYWVEYDEASVYKIAK